MSESPVPVSSPVQGEAVETAADTEAVETDGLVEFTPYLTSQREHDGTCERDHDAGWTCTRVRGHRGNHEAGSSVRGRIYASWPNVVSSSTREDGEPDECERPDCRQVAATASDVYCEITGGLLSYPTYDARTILAAAGDCTQRLIDEETVRLREEIAAAIEAEKSSNEFRNVVLDRAAAIARGASS